MKNNFIARFLERRNRLFENWKSGVVLFVTFVSALSFSLPVAIAQERKTLEEVLIEKGVLTQEEVAAIQGRKFSKWVDRVTFSGDLRLRYESLMKDPSPDRQLARFRLRVGSEIKLGDFYVGVRLASGTGSQVSTNQSFDNLFSQKPLWIDQAYLQWKGLPWVTLTTGRMPNPFYNIPDVIWDVDVNPEGFAENFQLKMSDSLTLFANAGQFVLDEDAASNHDQWLLGEQIGTQVGLGKAAQITLAAAYYNFKNVNVNDLGQAAGGAIVQPGNTRVPAVAPATGLTNRLLNPFRVLDIATEIAVKVGPLPVSLIGDYVKNLADTSTGKDTGYQVGGRVGKASDPQTWEVGYFYKILETDATLADLTDSDFGDGGTNQKGHIVWVAYQINKPLWFRTKYVTTKIEDESLPPGKNDVNRLQFDLIAKF